MNVRPPPRQGDSPWIHRTKTGCHELVGATVLSTRYMPDRMRRLARPYRWQASSHPGLCSHQCSRGCASSLWEQLSFLFGICPIVGGAWLGPIAGKPAPTQASAAINVVVAAQAACGSNCLFYLVYARPYVAPGKALSLASQLPPRSLQPSMQSWLRKQLVGATVFSIWYMPDRRWHLAGPYRWQASSHPGPCSHQCSRGCASSLWERACPRWRLARHRLSRRQAPHGSLSDEPPALIAGAAPTPPALAMHAGFHAADATQNRHPSAPRACAARS